MIPTKDKQSGLPRISLNAAKSIVRNELGISAAGLKREKGTPPDIFIYKMATGNLTVTVENDWVDKSGRIRFSVESGDYCAGSIRRYFDPQTLAEDMDTEMRIYETNRKEDFEARICEIGLDGCKQIIDRARA